jgi:hypothetical protein
MEVLIFLGQIVGVAFIIVCAVGPWYLLYRYVSKRRKAERNRYAAYMDHLGSLPADHPDVKAYWARRARDEEVGRRQLEVARQHDMSVKNGLIKP